MRKESPTLVWFRKDLRLEDNPALNAAVERGAPVIPVFILAPGEGGDWDPGAASRWWLHHALVSLGEGLCKLGGGLVLRRGASLSVLRELLRETGAGCVFWNRRYEGPLRRVDAEVKWRLRSEGVAVESFNGSLLNEPHTVATGDGSPYKVYTPYWKKVKDRRVDDPRRLDREALQFPRELPESLDPDALALLPAVRWDKKLERYWTPGEKGAWNRLDNFLSDAVADYSRERNFPDRDGTSALSPHLHWGHLSPGQVVGRLRERCDLHASGPQTFLREIYWREFAYNVLYHFPGTPDAPLREEFTSFPWRSDTAVLRAWRTGRTGYPIVDAGMRQLWETGWMHNRVRMIVSSFLVKHLLHNWHLGARWFWDTLVDADLASNTLGWQWSGGCGADAAPYFRIFNPIIQGPKFDPEGSYVRHYVPELKNLDTRFIHQPWEAPEADLSEAGLVLGKDYPRPIIGHKEGRDRALQAFEAVKQY